MKLLPPVGRPNGGRLGNRKETTGCMTCKRRKIKCDERKPFCHRCTSSGRECGGYADPPSSDAPVRSSKSSSVSPLSGEILVTGLVTNNEEARAFSYFATGRAQAVAGPFDGDLWSHLIPQLSQTIPAVRHAAMAIGALLLRADELQAAGVSSVSLASNEARNIFAVEQYQKAIRSTLHALNEGPGTPLLASTTCVLFFCIEALQGHEHEALRLYERGRKAKPTPVQGNSNDTLTFDVASTFSRLAVQWSMFEGNIINDITEAPHFDQSIRSISQAQSELISLVTYAFNVCTTGSIAKWSDSWDATPNQTRQELEFRQRSINNALDLWHVRFEAYKKHCSHHFQTPRHTIACSMLILWYNAMAMWLAGSLVRSTMIYDKFLPRFEVLIAEATTTLDSMEKQDKSVSFTFELGVIPPLYVSVLLCRHPVLRRQALELLRRAPAQEGLWRRAIIVRASERVIELEEGSDCFTLSISENLAQKVVPEEMRCKLVKVGLRTIGEDARWGNSVEFYSKPYGLDGAWSVYQQFFEA